MAPSSTTAVPNVVYVDRDRLGDSDRVGELNLTAPGGAARDHVLGSPPGRVGGRAIDLGGVLPAEGAAAVATGAAVGVNDNLAGR